MTLNVLIPAYKSSLVKRLGPNTNDYAPLGDRQADRQHTGRE